MTYYLTIKWDEDEDGPIVELNGRTYGMVDFFEDVLKKEVTWDDRYHRNIESRFRNTVGELEDLAQKVYEWDDEECQDIYFALASESVKHWIGRCGELGINAKSDYAIDDDSLHDIKEKFKTKIEETKFLVHFESNREEISKLLENVIGVDPIETIKLIEHNFRSGGESSRNILGEDGLLQSLIDDKDCEDIIGKIKSALNGMAVARHRHMETDYDSIDKKGMSEDQVSSLRKSRRSV